MSISRNSRTVRLLPRWRSAARWLPLGALLLAGCSDFVENVPPRPAASDDPAVAATPYPSLATVPARPRLGYTLEQRREIAQGLVADRANARHAGDTLRADLGRPVEPDTAPPLPPLPEAEPEPAPAPDPAADLALAYIEEALARDSDDGSLEDFLDRLERRPPAAPAPQPTSQDPTAATEPATPSEAESAPTPPADEPLAAQSAAKETFAAPEANVSEPDVETDMAPAAPVVAAPAEIPAPADPTGPPAAESPRAVTSEAPGAPAAEVVAETDAPPELAPIDPPVTAVANGPAPAVVEPVRLPIAVLFDPDQIEVADESARRLAQAARELRGNGMAVVVSGGGARAGLAIERARRVAALLASAGFPATGITIEMGGDRDAVVVYEADV